MAATGTPTPNIGLRIPQGTDPASVDDINYNSNLLDTKLGAVGNTSVQDQIDSLNSKTATTVISSNTLANIEAALVTVGDSLPSNGDAGNIRFTVSTASGLFKASRDYVGTIRRRGSSRYIVNVWSTESEDITGFYAGTWSWSSLNNNLSLYNATSQNALSSIVNAAKLTPAGAAIAFSGDSSTGTSLVGVAGVCFGNVKNVNASRMDYIVAQPSGGRIAIGTIDPSNNNAVTIVKVFS